MEVTKQNVAMLSNFELVSPRGYGGVFYYSSVSNTRRVYIRSSDSVYQLLKNTQEKTKKKRSNGRSQNVATITYETSDYLSKTPCAQQNPQVLEKFMKTMISHKLTKAEKLQLLNLKPSTPVELQLIIEEIEERFTDQETAELLEIIQALLTDTG